ncbi:14613_t:CDS:2 [Entrophospora sp. SA101]|nr:14613_t:CDS:2 [Entrophospora sp. SA101]
MKKFVIKECAELISDPIMLRGQDQRIFNHADLPVVKDELSVTLRLKLHSHTSVSTIFHKGTGDLVRTPGLWLVREQPLLYARFTGNWNSNTGIDRLGPALLLNKWYHITYTLSDSEKRLDVYIDGEWTGYYSIQHVKTQKKRPIAKGSKIALVHVPTRKYLSSKGVTYPTHNQWMVVCNGQEIDLKNDIWTFIEAHDARESVGGLVYFNTIIGFKHQATGSNLHSHIKHHGVTPKSKHQQVTLYGDVNFDDDWLIRRYSPNASYDDSGSLSHGDIISLFHAMSDKHKLALYSHDILLDDGTQEVACYGNGSDENNKWRIELVD